MPMPFPAPLSMPCVTPCHPSTAACPHLCLASHAPLLMQYFTHTICPWLCMPAHASIIPTPSSVVCLLPPPHPKHPRACPHPRPSRTSPMPLSTAAHACPFPCHACALVYTSPAPSHCIP